jgi:hypothetical protein
MRPILLVILLTSWSAARADTTVGGGATRPVAPASCATPAWQAEVARTPKTVAGVQKLTTRFDFVAGAASDDACRVALFKIYYRYYRGVQEKLADDIMHPPSERELKRVGWGYVISEGGNFVDDNSDWLPRHVGPRLPLPWREYITMHTADAKEGFAEDASLLITWTGLRERIVRWDAFLARHPDFELNDTIREERDMYLSVLLVGMDNAHAFGEDDVLQKDVRVEIEAYLADKQAARKELVREYYDMLKQRGFRGAEEAQAWLEKRKQKSMLGREPPRN